MDTTTLQNQLVALRADDGVLEQRLSELDVKLAKWLAALEAGQAALRELARKVLPSAVPRETPFRLVEPAAPVEAIKPSPAPVVEEPPRPLPDVDAAATAAKQESRKAAEEDDALLETLDPETARAIRVKRRLTRGKRRVRELLEEHRAAQAQAPAPAPAKTPERRGWWRRKNG